MTAYYDHVGDDPGGVRSLPTSGAKSGDFAPAGARFPGAFDNASGVAAILATARDNIRSPSRKG
ncbi:MAG: M28 family peptidase [Chloroflexota bacterium]